MNPIIARTPTRIDLAGGTIDLWPIHQLLKYKATVNAAINLDANVTLSLAKDQQFHCQSLDQDIVVAGSYRSVCESTTLPLFGLLLAELWREDLPPLSLVTSAGSPQGAGIGGSSALAIAMAAALCQARAHFDKTAAMLSEADLIRTVGDVEAKLIQTPTGVQDYWGAVRGGINLITFPSGRTDVETITGPMLTELERRLVLVYSGRSRQSAINNWEIFKRFFDHDTQLVSQLERIGELASQCAHAFASGDLTGALAYSRKEWDVRREVWPGIETDETRAVSAIALKSGAVFSRVCGAGGGGMMALFAEPQHTAAIATSLKAGGFQVMPTSLSPRGLTLRS